MKNQSKPKQAAPLARTIGKIANREAVATSRARAKGLGPIARSKMV